MNIAAHLQLNTYFHLLLSIVVHLLKKNCDLFGFELKSNVKSKVCIDLCYIVVHLQLSISFRWLLSIPEVIEHHQMFFLSQCAFSWRWPNLSSSGGTLLFINSWALLFIDSVTLLFISTKKYSLNSAHWHWKLIPKCSWKLIAKNET